MSIFKTIFSKIFPSAQAEAVVVATAPVDTPADVPVDTPVAPTASAPAPIALGDVPALLDAMPGAANLHWRTSIVDLLKLLGLPSDLATRKALAQELLYSGDPSDSATMNIWLHRQVMTRLAANGGSVPPELRD